MLIENQKKLSFLNGRGLSKELFSTNASSNRYAVQRWANFIAGFSIEFVESCLKGFSPDSGLLLDPYAGCGTTLVAGKYLGFKTAGYDPHIVFAALCRAKITPYKQADIVSIYRALSSGDRERTLSESARTFLEKLFTLENLTEIMRASEALKEISGPNSDLATAIFLRACELSCTAQTDGIYKAPDSKKRAIDFKTSLKLTAEMFSEDINCDWYQQNWLSTPPSRHYPTSSETMGRIKDESVCCVVTSPPYLNNFDYAEMTRMQLYLLGWADGWADITDKVRSRLVTNTTTAIAGKREESFQSAERKEIPGTLHKELDKITIELDTQRKIRPGKKPYSYLVYPYYAQITRTLKECFRTLQIDGRIHWVVSDAALYGIHIATEEHTAEIMRQIGFKSVRIEKLRSRGDRWVLEKRDGSSKGLGEYHLIGQK